MPPTPSVPWSEAPAQWPEEPPGQRERDTFVAPDARTRQPDLARRQAMTAAFQFPQRAVQANQAARARTHVQIVDILRDDGAAAFPRPLREDVVRRVRRASRHDRAP